MYKNIITEDVLKNWFSSTTLADGQLQSVITHNNFQQIKPTFSQISTHLFRNENPYQFYKRVELSTHMFYPAHIGNKTLNKLKEFLGHEPTLGIEVGSFIGSSALVLGNLLKQNNGCLICIDTWCGDINMWLMDIFDNTMNKSDGNPKIFDYFMTKMIDNDLTNTVIPLRVSSVVAARMLKVLKYEIDFVYVDSAHECGETFMELSLYHDILKIGGVLFGDDYYGFPAVKHDVDIFCKIYNYTLTFSGDGDTWLIKKT